MSKKIGNFFFQFCSLHLGPDKCDMAKLRQSSFLAKTKHLDIKTGKSLEITFAEISDDIVVRMLVCGEYLERNGVIGSLLAFAPRRHPYGIGIEKKTHHCCSPHSLHKIRGFFSESVNKDQ